MPSKHSEREGAGRVRTLLSHLAQPTDDWAYRGDTRRPSIMLILMSILLVLLGLVAGTAITRALGFDVCALFIVELVLLGVAGVIVAILMYQIRQHLLAPLSQLYDWALQMCDGDFSARIVPAQQGRFVKLSYHVNRLSEALDRLANQMDDMVWEQTERLQEKNQSLELLYEIVAAMHGTQATGEILESAARRLMSLTGADRATIHQLADDGPLELVSGIGFGDADDVLVAIDRKHLPDVVQIEHGLGDNSAHIAVPLIYQNAPLGLISLFAPELQEPMDDETRKLLGSVGQHLGMVIAKASLDENARNLALVNERTTLAHELHDSLAQTIAALRFQVHNLGDSMYRDDVLASKRDFKTIDASIEALNTEIRDLIANFRVPGDARGLFPAIEDLVAKFKSETDIAVYLHTDGETPQLSPVAQMQLLGIVREGLANARKHSGAALVRILFQCRADGFFRLLIEDDGIGFEHPLDKTKPGEHIGLSIMQERAERLGCRLRIESDPGDGTRVDLTFEVADTAAPEILTRVN